MCLAWQAVGLIFRTSPGASGWQCFKGNERATTRFPSLCLGQVCKCSTGRVGQPRGRSTEHGRGRMFVAVLTPSLGRDFGADSWDTRVGILFLPLSDSR